MKWLKYIICFLITIILMINIDKLTDIISHTLRSNPKVMISKPNEYYKDYDFKFVKLSEDFIPYSKQDLNDIFYSILDRGYKTFTFYCPSEYTECLNDIENISNDQNLLTTINNYVNPYNSFNNIRIIYSTSGEVNVEVTRLYSDDEIVSVNNRMDEIIQNVITEEMKDEDKILALHDYIINNTKYDENRKDNNSTYKSNKAYGSLIEGYAVCGGYADAMALFLDRLNIPNFKVSSETHVWNAIYINNKWLHLDLTWDDPISVNTRTDSLTHKFYLIDTPSLKAYKITDHEFDETIYQELA